MKLEIYVQDVILARQDNYDPDEIVIKTMLLIRKNGKLLLSEGSDKTKDEHFYRFLGGSLNFAEPLEDGIRREVRKELKCEIENLRLITPIEDTYEFDAATSRL